MRWTEEEVQDKEEMAWGWGGETLTISCELVVSSTLARALALRSLMGRHLARHARRALAVRCWAHARRLPSPSLTTSESGRALSVVVVRFRVGKLLLYLGS